MKLFLGHIIHFFFCTSLQCFMKFYALFFLMNFTAYKSHPICIQFSAQWGAVQNYGNCCFTMFYTLFKSCRPFSLGGGNFNLIKVFFFFFPVLLPKFRLLLHWSLFLIFIFQVTMLLIDHVWNVWDFPIRLMLVQLIYKICMSSSQKEWMVFVVFGVVEKECQWIFLSCPWIVTTHLHPKFSHIKQLLAAAFWCVLAFMTKKHIKMWWTSNLPYILFWFKFSSFDNAPNTVSRFFFFRKAQNGTETRVTW